MNKWLKKTGIILFVLTILVVITIGKVDESPIVNSEAYNKTLKSIEEATFTEVKVGEEMQVGWAKVNITPQHATRMAGYQPRHFNSVHDSIFVKTVLFDFGDRKIAWLTYDLIFVHPYLKDAILKKVEESKLADFVYLSATHTHSSIGSWGKDPLTRILYGYDQEVFDALVNQAIESIQLADQNKEIAKAGYFRYNESRVVQNRIDKDFGIVDPFIRGFKIQKNSGETACLYTYSAHPTSVSVYATFLSGDYPAEVNKRLEKDKVDFAMFSAGATSSMRARYLDIFDYEAIDWFSDRFVQNFDSTFDSLELKTFEKVSFSKIPVHMREPNLRFANNWRFRPWLVNLIVDQKEPFIVVLKLDNTVCMGLPIEFSGEIMVQLDEKYRQQDLDLVVTGLNGNYLGYVNRDCYYHIAKDEEVSLLNWYGPEAGNYFRTIIEEIVDKKIK